MRLNTFLLAVLLLAVQAVMAADKPAAGPTVAAEHAARVQVVAYYFHGTVRCETCQNIERQARELIERRFAFEVAEKLLLFKPVNYDKPENAHFLKDYKLPSPSLVVVREKRGKGEKWKLLDKTWEHYENPVKFNEYIEAEVDKLLRNDQ